MTRAFDRFLLGLVAVALFTVSTSAETISGWRGDGSGKYPASNPPTTWSRVSENVKGLRFSADKVENPDAGTAMPDGVIREWLVVGPLPLVQQKDSAESAALPDEAALEPVVGQEANKKQWRKVTLDSAYLDFILLLGRSPDEEIAAFAFTHVYSATGGKFRLNLTFVEKAQLWLNGIKPAGMGNRITLDLHKGWNRLLLRVSPGAKDWYAVPVLYGQGRCEYQESGIAWRATLPGVHPAFYGGGTGAGAPIVVGDRMYLLSEPHDLICLDKRNGKVVWIRRASYFEAASDDEKKQAAYADAHVLADKIDAINTSYVAGTATAAQLLEKATMEKDLRKQMKLVDAKKYANQYIPDTGFAGFTPCTDGRFIYAWFGDGVSACFDLDGARKWIRVDQHSAIEHGFSSSPTIVDGKLVSFMRDLIAIQCDTGALAWETPLVAPTGDNPGGFFHGSLVATKIGDASVILLGNGTIIRASDGKPIWQETAINSSACASPVVEGNLTLHITRGNNDLSIRTLPAQLTYPLIAPVRTVILDTSAFPKHYLPWFLASPVIDKGLAYMVNNAGVLSVIDLEAGTIVYQKLLDLDAFQAHNEGAFRGVGSCPILAGNHLYFLGNSGAALVIETGRVYKQVAKNKIESVVMLGHWAERQERFIANPIADGDRLYIRGEENLYAVGPP